MTNTYIVVYKSDGVCLYLRAPMIPPMINSNAIWCWPTFDVEPLQGYSLVEAELSVDYLVKNSSVKLEHLYIYERLILC